jgi:hypothetical protein
MIYIFRYRLRFNSEHRRVDNSDGYVGSPV